MTPPSNFKALVTLIIGYIYLLLPVIASLSLLAFVWGLTKFIANAADTKSHEDGKNLMKWGLIALAIMLSFMGILKIAYGDLGFTNFGLPTLPEH